MKRETYKAASTRLLAALAGAGYAVKTGLKVPYAVDRERNRVEFHAQSVYTGRMGGDMHSMWIDTRDMPAETFLAAVQRAFAP